MCGRVALYSPPARFARFLDASRGESFDDDNELNWTEGHPSWNVGPQRRLYAVRDEEGVRVLDRFLWGLIPSWSKDRKIANKLINARSETVAEKPSFRSAFAKHPCVIPVDGFFEWDHRVGTVKQPNYFYRVDDDPLLLAGLYEYWHNPEDRSAKALATCTIITTTPNVDMDEVHDRMPVVLSPDDVDAWIDFREHSREERLLLLRPAPEGTLAHHTVDPAVGSVRNDKPELIEAAPPRTFF